MYLWVVIATFITILYSFNLSLRPDLDRVHAETKASITVTRFRAQHNAVKDYLDSQATFKTGHTSVSYYPGWGVHTSSGDDANLTSLIEPYLPVGFSEDTSTVTKVYCLENGDRMAEQCVSGADGSCCSDEYVGIYVVSFREIPSRWINKVTKMPNADLLGAMAKVRGYGKNFGYTDTIDGKLVLSGGLIKKKFDNTTATSSGVASELKFEYHEIFEAVKNDEDFEKCTGENVHCLYAIQQIYG